MNVVDSSGWLEFFTAGPNAGFFAPPIQQTDDLLVPTISIYEVFTVVLRERGDDAALRAMTLMQQGRVIDLSTNLALAAAQVSLTHGIPMADSIMLATAQAHVATLWTQDADFRGLPNVKYVERRPIRGS